MINILFLFLSLILKLNFLPEKEKKPKISCLNFLYQDLPVLIINNWRDITKKFLKLKFKEIASKKYSLRKLHIEYWTEKINTKYLQ